MWDSNSKANSSKNKENITVANLKITNDMKYNYKLDGE